MSLRFDDAELAFPMPSGDTNEGTDAENKEVADQSDAAKSKTEDENAPPKGQIDMTKIIILGAGVLLIVFSLTAISLVATGNYGPVYNEPIPQMRGDMELEEMDGVLLKWKPEYDDLSSEETKQLKNSLKSKLLKALEEEGVEVDDIEITELSPGPKKTIKKVLRQKRRKPKGRAASAIPEELSVDLGATGMITTEMDEKAPTYTELTPDVQLVHVKYETKGVPAKNAPLFTAAHGRWNSVSNMIEARMASTGMNVHIDSMEPTEKFMDNVLDISTQNSKTTPAPAARYDPRTEATAQQASVSDCGCDATGMFVTAPEILKCRCSGPCIAGEILIFGGVNNIFRQCVKICPAAYYAGIIDDSGGIIEVINMGKGKVEAGNTRKSIIPRSIPFEDVRYKIKAPGQTISVTPAPTTANSWNVVGGAAPTTAFAGNALGGAVAPTSDTSWNAVGAPQASETDTANAGNALGGVVAPTNAFTGNAAGAPQETDATQDGAEGNAPATGWGQAAPGENAEGAGAGAGAPETQWGQASEVGGEVGGGAGVVGGGGGAGQPTGTPMPAFTLHIQYTNHEYDESLKDLTASKAESLRQKIEPEIKKAIESLEFVISEVKVKQFIKPPSNKGVIAALDIICDHGINVPIAVKVERTKVGVVPKKIELALTESPTPKMRSFRYQKDFLNEMTKVMSQS